MINAWNGVVYRIFNKKTSSYEGVYSRGYHDEYDFETPVKARAANCHGIYEDEDKYDIHVYKVTYKRIDK